ncbi:uncharacterized protein V1516DRAFT_682622 [Lipomyces oligophaga]|uniref:uncharacterized protein n=1 Tax=Lipomyces oligophaga TaxID=45792 RepID=UPI0034CECA85
MKKFFKSKNQAPDSNPYDGSSQSSFNSPYTEPTSTNPSTSVNPYAASLYESRASQSKTDNYEYSSSPYASTSSNWSQAQTNAGYSSTTPSSYQSDPYGPTGTKSGYASSVMTTSTEAAREDLFSGRTPDIAKRSENYDPSIMETESERRARDGTSFSTDTIVEDDEVDEETQLSGIKQQIKAVNKETIKSATNAKHLADEAIASGVRSLNMLSDQGATLSEIEYRSYNVGAKVKESDQLIKDLKVATRPLFQPHLPDLSGKYERSMEKSRNEQQNLWNATGQSRKQLDSEIEQHAAPLEVNYSRSDKITPLAFEPDEEDENDERQINDSVSYLSSASSRLNNIAKSISGELTSQNERLVRESERTSDNELGVSVNAAKLQRFHR